MIASPDERADPAAWFGVRHVIEPGWSALGRGGGSDAAVLACAAHLANRGETDHGVAVLGTSHGADAARALGLAVSDVTPADRSSRWPAARLPNRGGALTTVLWHAAPRVKPGQHAVVRAFDAPTPSLAAIGRRADRVDVFTERDRLAWAGVGVAARVAELPAFERLAASITHPAFPDLEDEIVIAATADRPSDLDARQFGFLLGLLAVAGHRVHGLMPRDARNASLVRRHIAGLDEPCRVYESRISTLVTLGRAQLTLIPPSVSEGSGAELVMQRWCAALGVGFVRWAQQPAGERRQTPGLAAPVIAALARLGTNA